jgi:hypothetical protein
MLALAFEVRFIKEIDVHLSSTQPLLTTQFKTAINTANFEYKHRRKHTQNS